MEGHATNIAALATRIEKVERRLAALEADRPAKAEDDVPGAVQEPTRVGLPRMPVDPEVFWALAGVRDRTDEGGGVLFTGSVRLPGGGTVEWQQGAETAAVLESEWSAVADALAALGHPIRLRLLREVLHGRRTAAELGAVEELGTTGQLYHHLRQLVAAGWLRSGGRGRYEVPAPRAIPLLIMIVAAQR